MCTVSMALEQLCLERHELSCCVGKPKRSIGCTVTDLLIVQLVYRYCPHNVGHHLGLEVHDVHTLSDYDPLAPGAVITIEPGALSIVDECS